MQIYIKRPDRSRELHPLSEVNTLLARGELTGEELGWRPGLSDWVPLRELEGIQMPVAATLPESIHVRKRPARSVRAETHPEPGTAATADGDSAEEEEVETVKLEIHPWRRFFARTIDVQICASLTIIVFGYFMGFYYPEAASAVAAKLEKEPATIVLVGFLAYPLWIPWEAAFLTLTGTTPGKWLFGIRIYQQAGGKLSFFKALKRTILVWVCGEGMGLGIVTIITRVIAHDRLIKTGSTIWDRAAGTRVTYPYWSIARAFVCTLVVIGTMIMVNHLDSLAR